MSAPDALVPQRRHRLIPLGFVTYSLVYIDRSNYALGAAWCLRHGAFVLMAVALLGSVVLTLFLKRLPVVAPAMAPGDVTTREGQPW